MFCNMPHIAVTKIEIMPITCVTRRCRYIRVNASPESPFAPDVPAPCATDNKPNQRHGKPEQEKRLREFVAVDEAQQQQNRHQETDKPANRSPVRARCKGCD